MASVFLSMGSTLSLVKKSLELNKQFEGISNFDEVADLSANEVAETIKDARFDRETNWTPPQPSSDARIWRYITLTQLLSILEKEQLWFPNISEFDDPYEGTVPKMNMEKEVERVSEELDISKETSKDLFSLFTLETSISDYYVKCWNISPHESAALWEQYIGSSQGVAISTNVSDLKSAINTDRDIIFGEVEYIDYEKELIPGGKLPLAYYKRKSFEHENEYRASIMISDDEEIKKGIYIDIDVDIFLNNMYISPVSPDWFQDLIKDLLDTYDIDCEPIKSDLYSDPVY